MTLGQFIQALLTHILDLVAALPTAVLHALSVAVEQPAIVLSAGVLVVVLAALIAARLMTARR